MKIEKNLIINEVSITNSNDEWEFDNYFEEIDPIGQDVLNDLWDMIGEEGKENVYELQIYKGKTDELNKQLYKVIYNEEYQE